MLDTLLLYNEPTLATDHPDYDSESGVLDSVTKFDEVLSAAGHRVRRFGIRDSLSQLVAGLSDPRPDVVVNLCEGFAGRPKDEPYVASLLELLGLPYTGNTPECLALVRDKARTKWLLQGAALLTAPFRRVRKSEQPPLELFDDWLAQGPLFIKPAAEDASLGIGSNSVVENREALQRQIAQVHDRYGDVLVERYIGGREFNVAIVALPAPQLLPLSEIEFQVSAQLPWPIVTYDGKWNPDSSAFHGTPVSCPAVVEANLARAMEQVSLAAFEATGCRDYARVDLRVTPAGELYILEVNANPDAGPSAGLSRALRISSVGYEAFICRLVEVAHARGAAR